jgi:hypothetical protein
VSAQRYHNDDGTPCEDAQRIHMPRSLERERERVFGSTFGGRESDEPLRTCTG